MSSFATQLPQTLDVIKYQQTEQKVKLFLPRYNFQFLLCSYVLKDTNQSLLNGQKFQ